MTNVVDLLGLYLLLFVVLMAAILIVVEELQAKSAIAANKLRIAEEIYRREAAKRQAIIQAIINAPIRENAIEMLPRLGIDEDDSADTVLRRAIQVVKGDQHYGDVA